MRSTSTRAGRTGRTRWQQQLQQRQQAPWQQQPAQQQQAPQLPAKHDPVQQQPALQKSLTEEESMKMHRDAAQAYQAFMKQSPETKSNVLLGSLHKRDSALMLGIKLFGPSPKKTTD